MSQHRSHHKGGGGHGSKDNRRQKHENWDPNYSRSHHNKHANDQNYRSYGRGGGGSKNRNHPYDHSSSSRDKYSNQHRGDHNRSRRDDGSNWGQQDAGGGGYYHQEKGFNKGGGGSNWGDDSKSRYHHTNYSKDHWDDKSYKQFSKGGSKEQRRENQQHQKMDASSTKEAQNKMQWNTNSTTTPPPHHNQPQDDQSWNNNKGQDSNNKGQESNNNQNWEQDLDQFPSHKNEDETPIKDQLSENTANIIPTPKVVIQNEKAKLLDEKASKYKDENEKAKATQDKSVEIYSQKVPDMRPPKSKSPQQQQLQFSKATKVEKQKRKKITDDEKMEIKSEDGSGEKNLKGEKENDVKKKKKVKDEFKSEQSSHNSVNHQSLPKPHHLTSTKPILQEQSSSKLKVTADQNSNASKINKDCEDSPEVIKHKLGKRKRHDIDKVVKQMDEDTVKNEDVENESNLKRQRGDNPPPDENPPQSIRYENSSRYSKYNLNSYINKKDDRIEPINSSAIYPSHLQDSYHRQTESKVQKFDNHQNPRESKQEEAKRIESVDNNDKSKDKIMKVEQPFQIAPTSAIDEKRQKKQQDKLGTQINIDFRDLNLDSIMDQVDTMMRQVQSMQPQKADEKDMSPIKTSSQEGSTLSNKDDKREQPMIKKESDIKSGGPQKDVGKTMVHLEILHQFLGKLMIYIQSVQQNLGMHDDGEHAVDPQQSQQKQASQAQVSNISKYIQIRQNMTNTAQCIIKDCVAILQVGKNELASMGNKELFQDIRDQGLILTCIAITMTDQIYQEKMKKFTKSDRTSRDDIMSDISKQQRLLRVFCLFHLFKIFYVSHILPIQEKYFLNQAKPKNKEEDFMNKIKESQMDQYVFTYAPSVDALWEFIDKIQTDLQNQIIAKLKKFVEKNKDNQGKLQEWQSPFEPCRQVLKDEKGCIEYLLKIHYQIRESIDQLFHQQDLSDEQMVQLNNVLNDVRLMRSFRYAQPVKEQKYNAVKNLCDVLLFNYEQHPSGTY